MRVEFSTLLLKDLRKVPKTIQCAFAEVVGAAQSATSVQELRNCKKLQGADNVYRVRIRNYRTTFLLIQTEDTIFFQRILTRGQIYKTL